MPREGHTSISVVFLPRVQEPIPDRLVLGPHWNESPSLFKTKKELFQMQTERDVISKGNVRSWMECWTRKKQSLWEQLANFELGKWLSW